MIVVGHRQAQTWSDEDVRTVQAAADGLAAYLGRVTQWVPRTPQSLQSLGPDTRFQHYIAENQRSLDHLMTLHHKLQRLGNLSDPQKDLLRPIEDSYRPLIQLTKLAQKPL